jgi:hypothetical protein
LGWVTYGSSRLILVGLGNLRFLHLNSSVALSSLPCYFADCCSLFHSIMCHIIHGFVLSKLPSPSMQSSAIPRVGFDVVAEKIHAVHRDLCPVHTSAVAAVSVVCQKVKSSFIERGGKRKADAASAKSTVAITPVALLALMASLSTSCPPERGAFFPLSAVMLINRDSTVSHHKYNPPLVLQGGTMA